MNRITEKLSSLNFAVGTLLALSALLIWGLVLYNIQSFKPGFMQMNNVLVRDWLMNPGVGPAQLKIWFIALCLVMVVMGVNLIFCTWNRIVRILNAKFGGPRFFMFIVHLIFGLVALGHFGGFMLGFKHADVPLQLNGTFSFKNGMSINITEIHFTDDPEILKKSRREITRDEMNHEKNHAEIALYKNNQLLIKKRAYQLRPVKYQDIYIALKRFTPIDTSGVSSESFPGVMLSIAKNPVLDIFLVIYPLMIMGIVIHLIMTWRRPDNGNLLK